MEFITKKESMKNLLVLFSLLMITNIAQADPHAGVVVRLKGGAEIFHSPSKNVNEKSKDSYVLFEGTYYKTKKAKLGTKVFPGEVVRTENKSKLRLVYRNGDQITVGSGTSYQIQEGVKKGKKKTSSIRLMYGAMRAVISKDGPRTGMKVNTKTAAMGVRGTDFFVAQRGSKKNTRVSVIRGEVSVKPKQKLAKEVQVKTGESAQIKEAKKPAKPGKAIEKAKKVLVAEVARTTKKELVQIQKDSIIRKKDMDMKNMEKGAKKEIKKLEKKAAETTLNDLKTYDKKLYEKVKKMKKLKSVDAINTLSVKKIYKKAPKGKGKLSEEEIAALENNAYEMYFNIEE
jgi:hypothetical protein